MVNYIYNDNTYEFKVYEKDIPLIMRYVPQTREKAVILLNPNNPAEKIFAQSNGKLKFFIFSLSKRGIKSFASRKFKIGVSK